MKAAVSQIGEIYFVVVHTMKFTNIMAKVVGHETRFCKMNHFWHKIVTKEAL